MAEGPEVEMVHVGMREQDEVDGRDLLWAERAGHVALGAEHERAETDAATREQRRVGEEGDAQEIDEDGGVPEPGGGHVLRAPGCRLGMSRSGKNRAAEVAGHPAEEAERVHRAMESGMAENMAGTFG